MQKLFVLGAPDGAGYLVWLQRLFVSGVQVIYAHTLGGGEGTCQEGGRGRGGLPNVICFGCTGYLFQCKGEGEAGMGGQGRQPQKEGEAEAGPFQLFFRIDLVFFSGSLGFPSLHGYLSFPGFPSFTYPMSTRVLGVGG